MPRPVEPLSASLHYLAAILDMRVLLLLLSFSLLLFPGFMLPGADTLDRAAFSLGAAFRKKHVETRDYVRVDVPAEEMQHFLHDPAGSTLLLPFLGQLQQAYTKGVAVVLHEPLWGDYRSVEQLLAAVRGVTSISQQDLHAAVSAISANMRIYQSILASDRLLLAISRVPEHRVPDYPGLASVSDGMRQAFHRMPEVGKAGVSSIPLVTGAGSLQAPLFLQGQNNLGADARLKLFSLQQGVRHTDWIAGQGIRVGEHIVRTSANAVVYPVFSSSTGPYLPVVEHYRLSGSAGQEIRRIFHEKTVVIAAENDPAADDLLYGVISLSSGDYAIAPGWLLLARLLVTVLLMLFFLLMPHFRFRVNAMVLLLAVVSLLLAQQVLLLSYREWMPAGQFLILLLAGFVLMQLWCIRKGSVVPLANAKPVNEIRRERLDVTGRGNGKRAIFDRFFSGKKNARALVRRPRDEMDTLMDTAGIEATAHLQDVAVTSPRIQQRPRSHLGRYQIQRELGRGAMGVVYLGFDPKISRQVAIKTLHFDQFEPTELPAVKERFFREAEAAGRLRNHNNIVTIYDVGEEPSLAYIAMDYVDGNSLAAHVRKGQLLDVEMVYWIMAQVADAVDYANAQGIVHRDIKPSNILFDATTNEVKVADFGIARIMDGSATRTKTGDILGSPLYMSPEQLKGEAVKGCSDIFSLGVTLYQLLTGELPFKGDTLANLSYQIVQCKFRPVDELRSGLPDSARKITAKAMQKNPENRYANAGEMADALQRALEKEFR